MESQNEIVKELAAKGDCVIVGKNADTILKNEKPLKLFVHAEVALLHDGEAGLLGIADG